MEIFFADPSEKPLPPEEVRIREIQARPWEDGRRVKVNLEVTPFLKRPSGQVEIRDAAGALVASASIVEAMTPHIEINLHLRPAELQGEFTVLAEIYYLPDIETVLEDEDRPPVPPQRMVVDSAQAVFTLP
ncbi:MAG: hypothetical protein D6803_06900 [Anaerolineae bacterium]|nr:MAG: hypothetical protein D6803_06900 [Anaerolineae bacterium]